MPDVILVDAQDNDLGTMEKMEAHRKGVLHRAFSVLLFNSSNQLLIQKRAKGKYHSAGLWTNTCCSHPLPGESIARATRRTLDFEMGIHMQPDFAYKFLYRAVLNDDLIENELDHVYTGIFDGVPDPNPDEVQDWKFADLETLRQDAIAHPEKYTYWFKLILADHQLHLPPSRQNHNR